MNKTEKYHYLKKKIAKPLKKLIPKFIKKRLSNLFPSYYFILTDLDKLPIVNYKNIYGYNYQLRLIKKFNIEKKQTSHITYPYLIQLLLEKFKLDQKLKFLDFGGANIDFFLELQKNFKNVEYYFYNLKTTNQDFRNLKKEFNLENLNIIDDIEKIFEQKYDFVNFGSSIQYFDNYESILKKISSCSNLIFFSGQTIYESNKDKFIKHLIAKQINGIKNENYCYFFNKENFFNYFLNQNYKLVFKKKNITDEINFKNFENIVQNIEFSDFLFSKN